MTPLARWHHRVAAEFAGLTLYEQFERGVILVLTLLIVVIVASATLHVALAMLALLMADQMNPSNQQVFQAMFGMIFTVLIGLELKHSLPVGPGGESVVRLRTVILIAMLAIMRKFIILDLHETQALDLFALAAAILALGLVYWLVRGPEEIARARAQAEDGAPHG